MNNILHDLYNGDYNVRERPRKKDSEYSRALEKLAALEDVLSQSLPDALKPTFREYDFANAELSRLACQEDFAAGFRLGVNIMLALRE